MHILKNRSIDLRTVNSLSQALNHKNNFLEFSSLQITTESLQPVKKHDLIQVAFESVCIGAIKFIPTAIDPTNQHKNEDTDSGACCCHFCTDKGL